MLFLLAQLESSGSDLTVFPFLMDLKARLAQLVLLLLSQSGRPPATESSGADLTVILLVSLRLSGENHLDILCNENEKRVRSLKMYNEELMTVKHILYTACVGYRTYTSMTVAH